MHSGIRQSACEPLWAGARGACERLWQCHGDALRRRAMNSATSHSIQLESLIFTSTEPTLSRTWSPGIAGVFSLLRHRSRLLVFVCLRFLFGCFTISRPTLFQVAQVATQPYFDRNVRLTEVKWRDWEGMLRCFSGIQKASGFKERIGSAELWFLIHAARLLEVNVEIWPSSDPSLNYWFLDGWSKVRLEGDA